MIQWLVVRQGVVMRLSAVFVCLWYLTSNCVVLTADEQVSAGDTFRPV